MTDSYAVDVEGVSKSFGAFKALNGVNLRVRQGEIYGLLGPNGAGKTTLIRLICGLLAAHTGTVTVLGQRMPNVGVLRHIGYMTQQAALYPALSVEENVSFFAAINGADEGVKNALELVELYDRRGSVVATLSGGLRQRCSLACALVHRPELLLLDEPTVGIDPQLRVQFWESCRRMAASGTTIIVSSHVMDEADRCQRLGLIQYGRLLAEGSPADIRAQEARKISKKHSWRWRGGKSHERPPGPRDHSPAAAGIPARPQDACAPLRRADRHPGPARLPDARFDQLAVGRYRQRGFRSVGRHGGGCAPAFEPHHDHRHQRRGRRCQAQGRFSRRLYRAAFRFQPAGAERQRRARGPPRRLAAGGGCTRPSGAAAGDDHARVPGGGP